MWLFDSMKAGQAAAPVQMPPLVHPKDAPATIAKSDFPEDFDRYKYERPAIAKIRGLDGRNSRALFAQMVLRHLDPGGAISTITMMASVRDLVNAGHPQASEALDKLSQYHETKIQSQAPVTATLASKVDTKKSVSLAAASKARVTFDT